jgi:hypothetical protein
MSADAREPGAKTATPPEDSAEARARGRLAAEKAFYIHLATYAAVIGGLFVIDAVTGPGWWFFWPALGWGLGVLVHGAATFGVGGFVGADWEERRLHELIEQERERRP